MSCPQKLFDLLSLADRYKILDLVATMSDILQALPITRENMIFTATVASNFKLMFEDVCKKVLVRCLKFLVDSTSGAADVFALITETKENFLEASLDILHEVMDVGNATLQLTGWGNLAYFEFDTEEYLIINSKTLATIPKLGAQWKIMHEFRPVEYPHETPSGNIPVSLWVIVPLQKIVLACISFPFPHIALQVPDPDAGKRVSKYQPLPQVGEWTRIEISCEEDENRDGTFFVALSVGGKELGRMVVESEEQTDVKIGLGQEYEHQPWFARGLVVLQKP